MAKQKYIMHYFEAENTTIKELESDYKERNILNMKYFVGLQNNLGKIRFKYKHSNKGLFF